MLDRERLSAITDNVVYDEPMSKHTTFRIGGTADAFVSPENALEIEKIIHFCKDTDTPYMLMGNGSNMLVGDGGIRGVVIHIGNGMSKCRIEGEEVYADAGILMSTLSKKILEANLTGFERHIASHGLQQGERLIIVIINRHHSTSPDRF